MKLRFPLLVLPFGSLIAINCGVRTPLDLYADDASGGGGGTVSNGSRGGSSGSGGRFGTGGMIFGGGGSTHYNTGGSVYAGGGYHVDGGTSGSFGGNVGGAAGSVVLGGRGGSPNTGGQSRTGGIANTGGSAGGSAGTIGRDAGPDARPDLIVRDLGNDLRDTGRDGTGGTIGSDGALGPDAGTCAGLAPNEELIDDLNDGDRFLPAVNGRAGAWFDSHDSSPKGTMSPDPNTGFAPTNTGDSCRKYAAYVSGSGYVLTGASFWFGIGSPYNASKYTGISFWGKIDPGTSSVLRVAFPDKDTDPDGNLCSTASDAGSNTCYDHYGYRVTLTSTWTKYTINFSQLAQESWGRPGSGFDPASLYQVLFTIPVGATFGIWIDDIAFTF